jgi:hypothetical protein
LDTDELTEMAYECLRIAEATCHTLTLIFGAMSDDFNNEDDYLKGILKRVKSLKRSPSDFIENWGLEEELSPKILKDCLTKIEDQIGRTLETPIQDRGLTTF